MRFCCGPYKVKPTELSLADYLSSLGGGERKYGRVLELDF